ncbi:MAG: hypothetical protein JOZ81_01980 [Chloroflexi bacterium]|nr:hypothetical protein [Chloroflexota bacterium]
MTTKRTRNPEPSFATLANATLLGICDYLEGDGHSIYSPNFLRELGVPEPTTPRPSFEQLEEWITDSVCEATDGCEVEPDGWCSCSPSHPSWLLRLGLI